MAECSAKKTREVALIKSCANSCRYNLDSMKPAPTVISTFHLAAFLSSLKGQGYIAFVVRPEVGDLPAPGAMQTRNNNQFYLTQVEIEGKVRSQTTLFLPGTPVAARGTFYGQGGTLFYIKS